MVGQSIDLKALNQTDITNFTSLNLANRRLVFDLTGGGILQRFELRTNWNSKSNNIINRGQIRENDYNWTWQNGVEKKTTEVNKSDRKRK